MVKGLGDRVDLVLDAGPTEVGIESTVVDLSGAEPVLLRAGAISADEIERVLGLEVLLPVAVSGNAARRSPGMTDRHYAPYAELRTVPAEDTATMEREARAAVASGRRVGAVVRAERPLAGVQVVRLPDDPKGYARELYAALHDLDDAGCDLVLVEEVPADARWAGVRDRLARAAHGG